MAGPPPHRLSSAASQRRSGDGRRSIRGSNPDVFSDDFALETLEVADGSNPLSAHRRSEERATEPCTTPQPSVSGNSTAEPPSDSAKRSKGSQRFSRGGSLTLRHDSPHLQSLQRTESVISVSEASDTTSGPQRTLSTSSTFMVPRTQSPYQGATGPSHPYGMYPQGIGMTRTPSVATNSTIGMAERHHARTNAPAHPYGMYSQNTVPEGDVSPMTAETPSISVGFPGLGQNYQRRLGPEGEEAADIIGPDGHTEQLPPYTRYPDGIPLKARSPDINNTAIVPAHPETSQDTLQSTQPPLSATRSDVSEASGTRLNVVAAESAAPSDESGSFKERWTEKGKRRMCRGRLPVWLVAMLVILLVFAGALLGGVIGRVIGRRRAASRQASAQDLQPTAAPTITVTATSLIDAEPLSATPTNLPLVPSGTFGVPLGAPVEDSHGCLTNGSQSNAWSCGLGGMMGMTVSTLSNGANQVQLIDGFLSSGPLHYGAQPPVLKEPYDLVIMLDKDDITRGPALFFQQYHDKLVVIPERSMSAGSSKRSIAEGHVLEARGPPGAWFHGEVVQIGDRPWFCFWNHTLLEGFIYITQDVSSGCFNNSFSSGPSLTFPAPTSTLGQTSSPLTPSSSMSTTSGAAGTPQISSCLPPHYPKVVKIEERRHATQPTQPYCQQMQVLNDGTVGQVTSSSGGSVIVHLNETESSQPPPVPVTKKRSWRDASDRSRLEKKDDGMAGSCHCVWISD